MRDPIDTAIDQVTARMVQVRADEDLALRIVGTLPERTSRFRWLIPQFAAIAAFAIAAIVWTTRDTATPSLLPSSDMAVVMAVPKTVSAIEPGIALGTQPLEPLEPLELLEPLGARTALDHERSLPALAVRDVAPVELPATPALTLAPIEITDLPLTAESFPPR